MNRIVEQIKGRVRVEVFGAFPESLLNASALSALELWELECVNENTLRFNAHEGDLAKLRELARACSCEMTVIESHGGSARGGLPCLHAFRLGYRCARQ